MPSLKNERVHGMRTRKQRSGRGFASMDPERVSELGRIGGTVAQRSGSAHKLTREERARGGKIGGAR